ncbi:MAG: hypothetical protein WC764_01405 [Candidatus Paceibacterota bacterium]
MPEFRRVKILFALRKCAPRKAKNERYLVQDTGGFYIPYTIQLGEYSMGGGMDGTLHILALLESLLSYAWQNDDGSRKANLNTVSNEWNDNNLFVFRRKSRRSHPRFGGG